MSFSGTTCTVTIEQSRSALPSSWNLLSGILMAQTLTSLRSLLKVTFAVSLASPTSTGLQPPSAHFLSACSTTLPIRNPESKGASYKVRNSVQHDVILRLLELSKRLDLASWDTSHTVINFPCQASRTTIENVFLAELWRSKFISLDFSTSSAKLW